MILLQIIDFDKINIKWREREREREKERKRFIEVRLKRVTGVCVH